MNGQTDTDKALASAKLIVGSLAMGLLTFMAVLFFVIGPQTPADPKLPNILLIVLVVLGLSEFPAYFVLRSGLLSRLRRAFAQEPPRGDPTARVWPSFFTLTLIGCGLAEGWGLFGAIAYMLSGNQWALLAPLLAVLLLALQFPTRDKLSTFVSSVTGRLWQ